MNVKSYWNGCAAFRDLLFGTLIHERPLVDEKGSFFFGPMRKSLVEHF